MSWIVYALLASILWGMSYALSGQLLRYFSTPFVMMCNALGNVIFAVVIGLVSKGFAKDIGIVKKAGVESGLLLAGVAVLVAASFFILMSIKAKNATMAAMVEITYPLFTALFVWAFFREQEFTTGTIIGALFIITGVGFIYFFDKAA